MAGEPIPESWIGLPVAVTLDVRSPEEFKARLDQVNDRGVAVTIQPGSSGEVPAFYPWNSVRRIRLHRQRGERKYRDTQAGKDLPGDPGWFT